MFGLKWLWKSNKTKIDTSNFVSKEFLNTTLQDYVNRDLLNTTLSNELVNYITINTAQTITGAKTFTEGVIINKNPVPLTLKATDSNKTYIVYKDSANNSNLSIGANATSASIEVNRGNLEIETQQENKIISINTGKVKFNRSVVEMGTEINAGYGGGTVKFIPEDTSIKTLQFYNSSATDARRFKLLIGEPEVAQNPATKNYVDNKITETRGYVDNQVNTVNTRVSNLINGDINVLNEFKTNTVSSLGYNLKYQDLNITSSPSLSQYNNLVKYTIVLSTLQETKFMSAVIHFKDNTNGENIAKRFDFSYATTWGTKIYFKLTASSNYTTSIDWTKTFIRIFYIDTLNTKTTDPYFIVEEEGK